MQITEFVWTTISFILTLMILSYIIGDNPLFRIATYLFIGVTAGYVAVIILYQVLYPRLLLPLINGSLAEKGIALVPLLLALLLLAKLSPKTATLGKLPMAFLAGSGAAVVIGGALLGTVFPQINATISPFDLGSSSENIGLQLIEGAFILIGTISTLVYFQFTTITGKDQSTTKLPGMIASIGKVGQIFIGITLGAIFAGVIAASLTALIERLGFVWTYILSLL
ncbi:MAG: hypothetical protein ABFD29_03620 [Anaerolineaceae bacterium]